MKYVWLGLILIIATIATGGLDIVAIGLATAIWFFFKKN